MSTLTKSRFITFEGIDGCGKSTQVELLYQYLISKNIKSIIVREPGGTSISEEVRDILLSKSNTQLASHTEALLMSASRAQLTKEIIIPKLKSGYWIISDRYADSTIAYQGGGRQLNIDWLKALNSFATYEIVPELTIYLDVPIDIISKRIPINSDRFEIEGKNFLTLVRNTYNDLAKFEKDRIKSIDGTDNINSIHQSIIKLIEDKGFLNYE
jgi:dTMP kinase